jgi:hypothetical protein
MEITLAIVGIALTMVAIAIAGSIYWREKQHLIQLKSLASDTRVLASDTREIGIETRAIAKMLEAGTTVREAVEHFFELQPTEDRQFTCYYPESFKRRPLPSIYAGDYHALQVLVGLLGQSRLRLCGISKEQDVPGAPPGGDLIYLCAPMANLALQARYPGLDLSDAGASVVLSRELQLPCWFGVRNGVKKIAIAVQDGIRELDSPAGDAYRAAAELAEGVRYIPKSDVQIDYGIVARTTDEATGAKTLIIAGIHQYGTWIAAEFFDRLCRGKGETVYQTALKGNDDFVVIVWGEFSTAALLVGETGVHQNYVWTRRDKKSGWNHRSPEMVRPAVH